jgi:hypothetical protein
VANTQSSKLDLDALEAKFGGECPGVLKTLPHNEGNLPADAQNTPRARGEFMRQRTQRSAIEYELDTTLLVSIYQPDTGAEAAFERTVTPLRWSDPGIAQTVREEIGAREESLTPPLANVCADMRAWELSGYRTLPATTKAFEQRQAALRDERRGSASPVTSLNSLLKRFEGPAEKALVRKTKTLDRRALSLFAAISPAIEKLHSTLGLETENPDRKREPPTVVGKGNTHAGTSFEVTIPPRGSAHRRSCPLEVSVEFTTRSNLIISTGTATTRCVSGPAPSHVAVACRNGLMTIATSVLARTRHVRLLLSDGHTVTSRVAVITARQGGPAAFYVQALRGPSPIPVSLTELDARGMILRVIDLTAPDRCKAKPAPKFEGPTFTRLAHGQTPDGTPFTVSGVTLQFPPNNSQFNLEVNAGLGQDEAEETFTPGERKKAFQWSLAMECPPHAFSIVYGILAAPGDSVLARTAEGLVPLMKVEIAAKLHSGGPLVYGAFSTLPSELLVRRSDGSTMYLESLAAMGKGDAEFCEGYAES